MLAVSEGGLIHAANQVSRGSAGLALRAAKLAGISVESMLGGALSAAGRCATCGHRAGAGRVALAAGGGQ